MPDMLSNKLTSIFNVVREVDLDAIRDEADNPFSLLITGQSDPDALSVAQQVTGESEIHPWIDVQPLPLSMPAQDYVAAIVVTSSTDALDADEIEAHRQLSDVDVPVLVVCLGAERAGEALARRGEAARVRLRSAANEADFRRVLAPALLDVCSNHVLAFGRQFQGLRPAVSERLIEETAMANAGYAFTTGVAESMPLLTVPLNVADVVILTKNQLVMAYKLALALGKEGMPRALMGEIIGVLGGGLLFRQIARQLIGLVPGLGIPAKTAVAYAGTLVIGRAVDAWVTEGVQLEPEEIKELTREAAQRGREVAQELVTRGRARVSRTQKVESLS